MKKGSKKKAAAIAEALKKLGKKARKHHRASSAMKRAAETTLRTLADNGVEGAAATALIGSVCDSPYAAPAEKCTKCHRDDQPMSGALCVPCTLLQQRAAHTRSFS
jgi:hypothetical protein